jgi:hypothetical protein
VSTVRRQALPLAAALVTAGMAVSQVSSTADNVAAFARH